MLISSSFLSIWLQGWSGVGSTLLSLLRDEHDRIPVSGFTHCAVCALQAFTFHCTEEDLGQRLILLCLRVWPLVC